jgi:uncharacterized membrane protein YeaQ/YmgE (transglycosylase-associated protein family)
MTLTVSSVVVLVIVAGICGALGQAIAGYGRIGCLGSVALGFIGALFGTWVASMLHLPELIQVRVGGTLFPVLWSTIGAALFVAFLSLFTRRRYYRT